LDEHDVQRRFQHHWLLTMSRRRFNERDVIRVLILQGVEIRCFRTGGQITLENVGRIEREHIHELKLGGPDIPENCRYSLKEAHAIVTNGNGATTAGSSSHRIAKAFEPTRIDKFVPKKKPIDEPRERPKRFGNTTFKSAIR
jgi:hypothetical protein